MNRATRQHDHAAPSRGSILLAVLVLIAVMTIGGLSYFKWTNAERRASIAYARQTQARLAADSGGGFLRALFLEDPSLLDQGGGLFDNPGRFRGLLVSDSDAPTLRVRLSLLAPAQEGGVYGGYRFGLEDESARINLNTLLLTDDYEEEGARARLLALPGVTEAIADALLDWIDEDDEPRQYGAEASYYSSLSPPYAPANGPLDSLEQLLLVRGVSPELLYGRDRDRNFVVDAREGAAPLPTEIDNLDGAADRGIAAYLTLSSAERNVNANGDAKIDVNQDDLQELHRQVEQALGRDAANFIVAFRQGGPEDQLSESGAPLGPQNARPAGEVQIDFDVPGNERISGLLALVGVNTSTTMAGDSERVVVQSPFPDDPSQMLSYLPDLMDNLTVIAGASIPGRVNVNQAPRAVLAGLPGMPPEAVDAILSTRTEDPAASDPGRRSAGWLLSEGLVDLEGMRRLEPFVTGEGSVYRAQCVGFYDSGGPMARVELVIDAASPRPTVRLRRELTPLGGGYTPADLGAQVDQEKTGQETPATER